MSAQTLPGWNSEQAAKAVRSLNHSFSHAMQYRIVEGCEFCATVARCESTESVGPAMFGEEPIDLRCELRAGHPGPHRIEWA